MSADQGVRWREWCPSPGARSNWLDPGVACPTAIVDVSDVVVDDLHNQLSLAWPTLSADGEAWPTASSGASPAHAARFRSRLVLTFLQSNARTSGPGASDAFFGATTISNTDPLSAPAVVDAASNVTNVVQPPFVANAMPNVSLGPATDPTTIPDLGNYMSIALQGTASDCSYVINANGGVDYVCAAPGLPTGNASLFWSFWPTTATGGNVDFRSSNHVD